MYRYTASRGSYRELSLQIYLSPPASSCMFRFKLMAGKYITVEGARQNNLKGVSVKIPLNKMTVVTGVSGSGKSSLVFDTIYAEGQRRYVETFSAYTRQFLDRMDKPKVDEVDGIPPAIAVDQTNPVRTSRSTVGTMTEINDYLKLLFARTAFLFCRSCGNRVQRDSPESVWDRLANHFSERENIRLMITFAVEIPKNLNKTEVAELLKRGGYERFRRQTRNSIEVVQDRVSFSEANRGRIVEDLEAAFAFGGGRLSVIEFDRSGEDSQGLRFSNDLHCPECDIHYGDPTPNMFSFNSPLGACDACKGFGRVIGIDYGLVIPDGALSLEDGAIKPWRTGSYLECKSDLLSFARPAGVPTDIPWHDLSNEYRRWIIDGDSDWAEGRWYGVKRFFAWLETKSYRMHIRVLLSRYRSYDTCPECNGTRLKSEALNWRIGKGRTIRQIMTMPLFDGFALFSNGELSDLDEAGTILVQEIRSRLHFLVDVGLGYLTLDRQSRTLSGGEVQRINLTTALGTSLVNTLFVLDEPSIGLHSRDIRRLISVLHRLRDAGNTLLVVEHDPEVIRAADNIIDLGPGPGELGGNVVFRGTLAGLIKKRSSLTSRYLRGDRSVATSQALPTSEGEPAFVVSGAGENNLKGIDVHVPLNRLVCLTGVSGSGKSTLLERTIYNGIGRLLSKPVERPGKHSGITGADEFQDVVLVDQTAIGKTARSNPVSYVGAFDGIRKVFAAEPLAKERGYTLGTFSFNSPKGQCPACSGSGFERIEMQFLSDVYIRCPECDGKRYRADILDVKVLTARDSNPYSISDVLELTVDKAHWLFFDSSDIVSRLKPLLNVGLGYLRLGQPVPTLSGGEAQRLKLAGHLATAAGSGRTLFLFDEPTTGLHFEDVSKLLSALRQLVKSGHSILIIEHNLDVIGASDWIIDLGPEGGDGGGGIVVAGPPGLVRKHKKSHTGHALELYLEHGMVAETAESKYGGPRTGKTRAITIKNAREHNLAGISLTIPRDKLTVITGVSGSGKSTLAFDILFAEGQRRYLESLNAYARQFAQPAGWPDVDGIYGVPPTVAIEQRTSRGGHKSTVGTVTEVYHYLRLLFVRLGIQYCPKCNVPIQPQTKEAILSTLLASRAGQQVSILAPLIVSRKGYYTDLARWALSKGYDFLKVDGSLLSTTDWPRLDRYREHSIELPVGTVRVSPKNADELLQLIRIGLAMGNRMVVVASEEDEDELFSAERACPVCSRSFPDLDPRLFSFNSSHGWCGKCEGSGRVGSEVCPECGGTRLRSEALSVRFHDITINEISSWAVSSVLEWVELLDLGGREAAVGEGITHELVSRLKFLCDVGLRYLSLDRGAPTLSGGEAQRIRLAAQLGTNLRGACYVLDEPTIGLHPRDNHRLLSALKTLKDKGNTVVVVEHDEETIRSADFLIDLGPGGGDRGGQLVAAGSVNRVMRSKKSITGRLLVSPLKHPFTSQPEKSPKISRDMLRISRVTKHNFVDFSVDIPLGTLVCITGVSGSGKSTLLHEVVYAQLHRQLSKKRKNTKKSAGSGQMGMIIKGIEHIDRVLEVNQTPIGKTPRSCPATYIGFWERVRRMYASLPESRLRGYTASRFSYNVAGGRCEGCKGQGLKKIEMSFLPNVHIRCEECGGARFHDETLAVTYRGKSIADVLSMSIDEAVEFFSFYPEVYNSLKLLQDIGLGYIRLGQQSPTLSGGEAQRIKIVAELSKTALYVPNRASSRSKPARTLYVLDEPTIGLHMADVERLVRVLKLLVRAGNSVIVIEHNLDVIAESDWIIDLGPEGGDNGGKLVAEGSPREVSEQEGHTASYLRHFLDQRWEEARPASMREPVQ